MQARPQGSALEIDLTRLHRRTVTSFYSNLVTRPTGRAVRLGVEQQLAELPGGGACLSILDFSQVRILDYSCADEIVAKLLLAQVQQRPKREVYYLARGLHEHHVESVEAVLERHQLLLAAHRETGEVELLGSCDASERTCWDVLVKRGRLRLAEAECVTGMPRELVSAALERLIQARVALVLPEGLVCAIPRLANG